MGCQLRLTHLGTRAMAETEVSGAIRGCEQAEYCFGDEVKRFLQFGVPVAQ